MSNIAISVEDLGKKYQIGELERYYTLRDKLSKIIASPFRLFSRTRSNTSILTPNTQHLGPNNYIWALKDVSFEVGHGEIVGVIGRNGAGKTTLLKILSRITEPTEGYARINGRVASLLEVGTGFHPELTGRENIYLNGSILGMSHAEIKRKFDEIVDFAETEKFLDTPVKRYSSGMQVRLAFAVAAHLEPEILIIDEVLAVGDAAFQKKCIGKMEDVSSSGRTILFVSHNLNTIQRLCTRTIYLEKGKVKKDGDVKSICDAYLNDNLIARSYEKELIDIQKYQNHLVYFTKFDTLDSDWNIVTSLLYGEEIKFQMEIIAEQDINNISLVVGVDSLNGERIVTIDSLDTDSMFDIKGGSTLKKYLTFTELKLMPGDYYIYLSILRNNTIITVIRRIIMLNIKNIPFEGIELPNKIRWGFIRTPVFWKDV